MKISEFSSKYDISNDTVRYYMKLNLIVPQKKGGHYFFNKKCEKDIEEILKLKDMGFTLQEIKKIFYFKRIGKLTAYQKNNYYQNLYKDKIKEIENKIEQFKKAKNKLELQIQNLEKNYKKGNKIIGISLDALSLFECPECGSELSLSAENVKDNQVIKGSLDCSCGVTLNIEDGILYSDDIFNSSEEMEITDDHIEEYIKETESDFIDESYQSLDWLKEEFIKEDLDNKIILEPGSGYGHFLRQVYDVIPETSIYVCIDNNSQLNKYLKSILETAVGRANIIFITADLPNLPLKENLIDIFVDFTGTSSYCFDNTGFLPNLLDKYLSIKNIIIAQFIIYHRFGNNNIVEPSYRENFRYQNVRNKLVNQGFEFIKEYKSEVQKIKKSMGKYEDFAQPGDQIFSYQIKAQKNS